jgi:1,4-dihydroxy-2-naphthoyl-CoA hydrolase
MFHKNISIEKINSFSEDTLLAHLQIEFTEIGDHFLTAKMPVNKNNSQPMGILHGGASVALAESIGSVGSNILIDQQKEYAVGLSINANHVGSARNGTVYGKGIIVHKGKSTHVWSIEIKDDLNKLISVSRLTVMIINKDK